MHITREINRKLEGEGRGAGDAGTLTLPVSR
jgi:hypothetical protein